MAVPIRSSDPVALAYVGCDYVRKRAALPRQRYHAAKKMSHRRTRTWDFIIYMPQHWPVFLLLVMMFATSPYEICSIGADDEAQIVTLEVCGRGKDRRLV